jgi:hypothetical protein
MRSIDKQALRINAQLASSCKWIKESGDGLEAICSSDDQANAGFIVAHFEGPDAKENREFIQAANPATVLALLDQLEAAEKRIAEMIESNRLLCADSMIKQDRIAELEARKVKIKLPASFYPGGDIDCPLVINEYQIIEAIVAADCKPIAVCPRCKCELDLSHKPDGAADGAAKGE